MTGVIRTCGNKIANECEQKTGVNFPEVYVKNATGNVCSCTGDLCNGSAPLTTAGRMTLSFTMISLLALAAAGFLSQ